MQGAKRDISGHCDIAVIGGGPVGAYSASLLSRIGFSVVIIEEHMVPGHPTQCAGLVNAAISKLPDMKEISSKTILSEIKGADVHSPSGSVVTIKSKNVQAITIDRGLMDRMLVTSAARNGSCIKLGCKITGICRKDGKWKVHYIGQYGEEMTTCDLVLICDGANHTIRRKMDLRIPQENIPGISCEISFGKKNDFGQWDMVGIFTGSKVAPGFFSWAIPCFTDNSIRVGLASTRKNDLRFLLNNLLSDQRFKKWSGITDAPSRIGYLKMNFGNISLGPVDPYPQKGILLLGDSSGMTKPTSGGGIYPGLLSASLLADTFKSHDMNISHNTICAFSRAWKKGMGRELERSMILRRIVREITDEEIDRSIDRLSGSRILKMVNDEGDIDHPFSLAVSVLTMDPSLIFLIPRFIPYLTRIARG